MAHIGIIGSGWIAGTDYFSNGDGTGTLVIHTRRGDFLEYLDVPAWVRGLLHAGAVKVKPGHTLAEHLACSPERSVGRAYNKLVKGRYHNASRAAA